MSETWRSAPSFYIGKTTTGVSRPVFFSTNAQTMNNRPAGIIVTGASGSGKTNFLLTLAAMGAITNSYVFALDHKGDFTSLIHLQDELGEVNLWNISAKDKVGFLDPFYMTEDKDKTLEYALIAIEIFLGGLSDDERTALLPIVKDVNDSPVPSLSLVVDRLRGSMTSKTARNLGFKLAAIRDMRASKAAFAPTGQAIKKTKKGVKRGLTIVIIADLDLNTDTGGEKDLGQNLTAGMMYLITQTVFNIMREKERGVPKILFIDEAWSVVSNNKGAKLINDIVLLGRSYNMGLVLATQSIKHFDKVNIKSNVPTWFSFRNNKDEGEILVDNMRLPEGQGFEEVFSDLNVGECIMKDCLGRYARVQIDNWNKVWAREFDTNPLAQAKREKERREKENGEVD